MRATASVEGIYDALAATKPNTKISKAAFMKKTKREMEAFVVTQIMGKPEQRTVTFSGEFAEKFSQAEKTAREQAKSMNLSKRDTEVFVQRAVRDEVSKALEDRETQSEIIKQIGTDEMAKMAVSVANKDKAVQAAGASKYRHSEVVEAIHSAENDRRADSLIDGAIDRIEQATGVKVDREKARENIKQTLEEVMVHNATEEPESVRIAFGRDLSGDLEEARSTASSRSYGSRDLTDDQIEEIRERHSLTDEQVRELRESSRPADEQYHDMAREIIHESLNEGAEDSRGGYTPAEKRALESMSPDDLAIVLTRALDKEGSIERKTYTEDDLHAFLYGDQHTRQSEDQVRQFAQVLNQSVELQRMSNEAMLRLNLPTEGVVEQIRKKHKSER